MQNTDIAIIGGGIVGAATAWRLKNKYPSKRIVLLEKEAAPARHQTGRNSGVIHAGVYYAPGSLKSRFCREGLKQTIAFCQQYELPYLQCGKLIVATNDTELERLSTLIERSRENGLETDVLDAQQMRSREPNIVGKGALLVKDTGITDYKAINQMMITQFEHAGGEVRYQSEVTSLIQTDKGAQVKTAEDTLHAGFLINCAGLYSDRLIRKMGLPCDFKIIPFRGEYYRLPERFNDIVNHLIYPVPDPEMPFLGVHLTRMIDGSVTVGPNAVLAMAREGYRKYLVNPSEFAETLAFPGFWRLVKQHWRSGFDEFKNSVSASGYLKLVQKYCPKVTLADLLPHPSGVRAQAVTDQGELLHDFRFVDSEFSLHIGNAPSPAATSAIPIADSIVDKLSEKLA